MNEKQRMLREYQIAAFCTHEAVLFLDTHPDNRKAMEYYRKSQAKMENALKAYEAKFGPLTASAVKSTGWNWITTPWPWQKEE